MTTPAASETAVARTSAAMSVRETVPKPATAANIQNGVTVVRCNDVAHQKGSTATRRGTAWRTTRDTPTGDDTVPPVDEFPLVRPFFRRYAPLFQLVEQCLDTLLAGAAPDAPHAW
ncbi:hypothetical protein [Streptomyces malaysiensis]|uniref:hypothetical protein n=1 Tax=Streptomyces malaysiensis TaxID=92644 RepID=UPI002B29AA49|nr:hypothetical protein R8789_14715 [Streptomyces malaysiensis]